MRFTMLLLSAVCLASTAALAGCASKGGIPLRTISEEGLNLVRVETDPDGTVNTHPARLTPQDIATLLRDVRAWEQRNVIHRLFSGPAPKTRAFRDDEIEFLAPALSKALA